MIATAETRDLAIAKLTAALRGFTIRGVRTNVAFLVAILVSAAFRRGDVDTAYLDREGATLAALLQHDTGAAADPGPAPVAAQNAAVLNASYDPWSGGASAPAAPRSAPPPTRRRSGSEPASTLTAPMPATVLKVHVKPGDAVRKAMKMELPLRAPADATVAAVHTRDGERVQADAVLVELQ